MFTQLVTYSVIPHIPKHNFDMLFNLQTEHHPATHFSYSSLLVTPYVAQASQMKIPTAGNTPYRTDHLRHSHLLLFVVLSSNVIGLGTPSTPLHRTGSTTSAPRSYMLHTDDCYALCFTVIVLSIFSFDFCIC